MRIVCKRAAVGHPVKAAPCFEHIFESQSAERGEATSGAAVDGHLFAVHQAPTPQLLRSSAHVVDIRDSPDVCGG